MVNPQNPLLESGFRDVELVTKEGRTLRTAQLCANGLRNPDGSYDGKAFLLVPDPGLVGVRHYMRDPADGIVRPFIAHSGQGSYFVEFVRSH